MLLKEEFASNMSYLEPSINSMIVAGEGIIIIATIHLYAIPCRVSNNMPRIIFRCLFTDLMTNKALQEVLYMVICAGNFLNSVRIPTYLIRQNKNT